MTIKLSAVGKNKDAIGITHPLGGTFEVDPSEAQAVQSIISEFAQTHKREVLRRLFDCTKLMQAVYQKWEHVQFTGVQ